jgi:hypothetical protein
MQLHNMYLLLLEKLEQKKIKIIKVATSVVTFILLFFYVRLCYIYNEEKKLLKE